MSNFVQSLSPMAYDMVIPNVEHWLAVGRPEQPVSNENLDQVCLAWHHPGIEIRSGHPPVASWTIRSEEQIQPLQRGSRNTQCPRRCNDGSPVRLRGRIGSYEFGNFHMQPGIWYVYVSITARSSHEAKRNTSYDSVDPIDSLDQFDSRSCGMLIRAVR
jgi:hypothetical protein